MEYVRRRSVHCKSVAIRALFSSSSFAKNVRIKSPVHVALQQLAFIPEMKRLDEQVPAGRYVRAQQGARSESVCAGASSDATRIIDICGSMGAGNKNVFLEAAFRRAISQAESCGDVFSARKLLQRLEILASAAAGPEGADLDSLDGYARCDIAETHLAVARLQIAGATLGSPLPVGEASRSLVQSSSASAVSDELAYAQAKGDAPSVAALLPNALAHARAHALALLVNKLKTGISTVEPDRSPPRESKDGVQHGPRLDPEAVQLEQVVAACQAAEEAVARVMHTAGEEKELSIRTAQYVQGRCAVIRASARRNLAATHLLSATAHMAVQSQQRGEGIPISSQYALAHLTTAHEHLTAALEQINAATTRQRDISAADRQRDAAGGESNTAERERGDAWRRLGWDCRAMRADLAACTAEVGLLMALWTVWMPGGASLSSGQGEGRGISLFPLDEEENEAVAPVLKTASAAAEAALREYDSLEAAYALFPAPAIGKNATLAYSDHGCDPGAGTARALRVIALLHHVSSKAVTAEGLLRAALDKHESVRIVCGPPSSLLHELGGGGSLGGYDSAMVRWKALPALHQANIAGVLYPYAALLQQWEKRERESDRLRGHASTLLTSACTALNVPVPQATGDAKVDFVAAQTATLALSTAHCGSWGLVMPMDYLSV